MSTRAATHRRVTSEAALPAHVLAAGVRARPRLILLSGWDILVLYAVCGALVYPARRLSARTLLALGLAILAIGSLISILFGMALGAASPEIVREWNDLFWHPHRADC